LELRTLSSLAALVLILCGCGGRRAWTTEDSWYRPRPAGTPAAISDRVDAARVYEVVETWHAEAEALLAEIPILEITDQQAAEFAGQELTDAPGTRPYLVRGVYLNRGTGGWSIRIAGDELVVHHGSLGRSAVPMKRQALILQLERAPAQVYVTCSMAE
jgi:hypothetical protein